MTPYRKGYNAGKRTRHLVDVSANPYKMASKNWIAWNNGWNAAWHGKKEAEIRQRSRDEFGYRRSIIDEVQHWRCQEVDEEDLDDEYDPDWRI